MPESAAVPELEIRRARAADFAALWPILREVIRAGETYALDPDMARADVRRYWMEAPRATYVAWLGGRAAGSYYIRTNQPGGGAHVCNCGYMVASWARGRGIARQMCLHSQDEARRLGYLAMQFNFVLASNAGALALWRRLGFAEVGRIPGAFRHPRAGLTDALVMHKWLVDAGQVAARGGAARGSADRAAGGRPDDAAADSDR
ncbi:MAG: GNAT family N-acetyltransferase [Roseovarius sp.]